MPDEVWIAAWRKGLDHHRVPADSLTTACGRYTAGRGAALLPANISELESKPCPRCWPAITDLSGGPR